MNRRYLSWIDDDVLISHVSKAVQTYNRVLKRKHRLSQNKFREIFESILLGPKFNKSHLRADIAISFATSDLHQDILSSCDGWHKSDLLSHNYTRIDVSSNDKKVLAVIKHSDTAMNSSMTKSTYNSLLTEANNTPDSIYYIVYAATLKGSSFDQEWVLNGQNNPRLRKISIDRFYALVTGIDDALDQLIQILPQIINLTKGSEISGEQSDQHSVFISYHRKSSAMLAQLIAEKLKQHNIGTFVDTIKFDGAGSFPDKLRTEITKQKVFVCLLGAKTLESDWVKKEIEHAYKLKKPMVPVFQESYVPIDIIEVPHIDYLLNHDGVMIFDEKNVYIDDAIDRLITMIKLTQSY